MTNCCLKSPVEEFIAYLKDDGLVVKAIEVRDVGIDGTVTKSYTDLLGNPITVDPARLVPVPPEVLVVGGGIDLTEVNKNLTNITARLDTLASTVNNGSINVTVTGANVYDAFGNPVFIAITGNTP